MRLPSRSVFFAVVLLALAGLSATDPAGLRKHLRLSEETRRIQGENRQLEREIARLRREARALAGDPAALERAAREDLGYLRPGERVYRIEEPEGGR